MNILLIYPPTPETFWSFKQALAFVSKRAAFPPLEFIQRSCVVTAMVGLLNALPERIRRREAVVVFLSDQGPET